MDCLRACSLLLGRARRESCPSKKNGRRSGLLQLGDGGGGSVPRSLSTAR